MIQRLIGSKPPYSDKVAICCIVKDESHYYLREWIEYHLKIGVSRFFIYDNESNIPIAKTLQAYVDKDIVKVEFIGGKAMQKFAYDRCLATFGPLCQWIAFIDADEFIVPKTLTGNLPEFLTAYENYGGLGINWLVFGSNGHVESPQGLQTQSYTKRSLKTNIINDHIKTIVQPRHVKYTVNPHSFYFKRGKYCVNENFERLNGPRVTHTSNKIQLNHYYLRSLEDFKKKLKRGRADDGTFREMEEFYNVDKDANVVIDESIIELKMLLNGVSLIEKAG